MDMDNVEFDREPPGNLSTLVIAFGGWIDAGQAATGAVRHLVRELPAARLASIVPEGSSSCSRRNGPRCGSGPTRAATSGGRAANSSRGSPRTGRTATREHVEQLERDYDEAAGAKREELPEKLDSEQLMRELDNFLRKQREGGEEESR
jgi:hypothetical protein